MAKDANAKSWALFSHGDGTRRSYVDGRVANAALRDEQARLSAQSGPAQGSILFVTNAANNYEYGRMPALPVNFGAGEFTYSIWVNPTNATASSYAFGDAAERTNWSAHDVQPYSAPDAWYHGNFLLDGHTNAGSAFYDGTFSLQIIGSGRVRWTFGDGSAANARVGDVHAVQEWPSSGAASILDGNWHKISCVRRWDGGSGAILELWVDGILVATETTTIRTNMYTTYWDDFAVQSAPQRGWFFGSEKQAAVGDFAQYAAFMGGVGEMAFYSKAQTTTELEDLTPVRSNADGLLEVFRFAETSGSTVTGQNGTVMNLVNGAGGQAVSHSSQNPFG